MALFDLIDQPYFAGFVTSETALRAFDVSTLDDGALLLVQLSTGRTAFVQWTAASELPDDPDRGIVTPNVLPAPPAGRWVWFDYAALAPPRGAPGGQLGGTWETPDVRGLRASDGSLLTLGAIADGQAIVRSGANALGAYGMNGWTQQRVRLSTTANIAVLSGLLTVDGTTVADGDLVLVKNQTTASQNGLYVASGGAWTRAPQGNTDETLRGTLYRVQQGTANGGRLFVNTNLTTITVGATSLTYAVVTRLGSGTPGAVTGAAGSAGSSLDAAPFNHTHQVNGGNFGGTSITFAAVTDGQLVGRVGTTLAAQTTLRGRLLALSQPSQTQAAAATIDWTTGHKQLLNMTGNVALTFTAPGGPTNLTLVLVQDATGGRSPTWPATARAVGGQIRVATAPNAVTVVSIYFDGTNYWMDSAPGLTGPVSTLLV